MVRALRCCYCGEYVCDPCPKARLVYALREVLRRRAAETSFIRLTKDVPVEMKHGMLKGRVFEVDEAVEGQARPPVRPCYWVIGDVGERVRVWIFECEEVELT